MGHFKTILKTSNTLLFVVLILSACNGNQLTLGSAGGNSKSENFQSTLVGTWNVIQEDSPGTIERYEITEDAISHVLVCDHTIGGQEIIAVAFSEANFSSDKIEILSDAEGKTEFQKSNELVSCFSPMSKGSLSYTLEGDTLTFIFPSGAVALSRKK